jgi:hypothetical protein
MVEEANPIRYGTKRGEPSPNREFRRREAFLPAPPPPLIAETGTVLLMLFLISGCYAAIPTHVSGQPC